MPKMFLNTTAFLKRLQNIMLRHKLDRRIFGPEAFHGNNLEHSKEERSYDDAFKYGRGDTPPGRFSRGGSPPAPKAAAFSGRAIRSWRLAARRRRSTFVFFFQFHQGIQILTNLLLPGLHVDLIGSALSVSDFFSLLSFRTHLHLHSGKK